MVSNADKEKLQSLKRVAESVIPPGGHVWLYGSRARGEAHENSDWDILILLQQDSIMPKDEDAYAFPFVMEGWKLGMDVSPQAYTYDEWNQRSFTPYHKNIERDKVVLL